MGAFVYSTESAEIKISGTDTILDSIYIRCRQTSTFCGEFIDGEFTTHLNKDKFEMEPNNFIFTNVSFGSIGRVPVPKGYSGRDYLLTLLHIANLLEGMGFRVEIEDTTTPEQ